MAQEDADQSAASIGTSALLDGLEGEELARLALELQQLPTAGAGQMGRDAGVHPDEERLGA